MHVIPPAILLVDDEESSINAMRMALQAGGIGNVVAITDSRRVKEFLAERACETVLLDLVMPHVGGEELLAHIVNDHPDVPVIVVTGTNDVSTAVSCMRRGAYDYLVKPLDKDQLLSGVRRAVEVSDLRRQNLLLARGVLSRELDHPEAFASIVTGNPGMHALFKYIEVISSTRQPVLITGETGTGKDLAARAVHELSGVKGEFVAVNIAGFDDTMFADALFGHKKGAFTGAADARAGLAQRACDGTLFLDEIGDLSIGSQVKLLRLLQDGEFFPLGSDVPKRTNARVIVATSQDLRQHQKNGNFRQDLYYRLRTHHVHLPPLRERLDDLELLLRHFIAKASMSLERPVLEPTAEILHVLSEHAFPGNVRELEAMVFDAFSRSTGELSAEPFSASIAQHKPQAPAIDPGKPQALVNFSSRLPTLKQVQDSLVSEALRRSGGNQALAANYLGITRQAMNKRIQNLRNAAIDPDDVLSRSVAQQGGAGKQLGLDRDA
jgi:DNA-binding NtrC family response regulator